MSKGLKSFLHGLFCSLLLMSCVNDSNKVNLIQAENSITSLGLIKSKIIDNSKPKVVTYIGSKSSLERLLEQTPVGKIDLIIKQNSKYEFIFYIDRVLIADTSDIKTILTKYNCQFSLVLDLKDEYYKINKNLLNPMGSGRLSLITHICDKNNNVLDYAAIGSRMSFFDKVFAKYR